jgi:hypothetical protein
MIITPRLIFAAALSGDMFSQRPCLPVNVRFMPSGGLIWKWVNAAAVSVGLSKTLF